MKKMMILAVAFLLGSTLNTADAAKKKNKKQKQETVAENEQVQEPLILHTASDSLSYTAGKAATQGLLPYLQQQLKVDTACIDDFVKGYEESLTKQNDPKFIAYQAGMEIAKMAKQRILPSMKADFEGSNLTVIEEIFHKGFVSSVKSDNSVCTDSAAQAYFEKHRKDVKETLSAAYKKENEEWLETNKQNDGVIALADGLQYKVITMGEGEKPQKEQTVEVKYEGKLIDGTVFDSSYKRNPQTTKFRCDQVIKGWTEALQMMPVGSKWELYIPQNLAYGERQAGKIKPFSTLIFTVELVSIVEDEKNNKNVN